ncbi:MAG: hypothetical protein MUO43_10140 [Desulfobacterales bacterium]|nr:hypothetical protein [Desulfobacterales bacterium]
MVDVVLKLPNDFKWIMKNKEGMKWVESAIINRLTEIKIGNLLAEKSELKEKDVNELDHIIKRALYYKIKAEE